MKPPKVSHELQQRLDQDVFIASGSTHPQLAEDTAAAMQLSVGPVDHRQFPNGELYGRYEQSVRGKHVFVVQSHANQHGFSVNDSLIETGLLVDAAKRASASQITVVAPYLAYGRQDRKAKGREPISAAFAIRTLAMAGARRMVSIDMHAPQTQATFNDPFDHLTAEPLIRKALKKRIKQGSPDEFVVVSPDSGRAKSAERLAGKLKVDLVHMPKSRDRATGKVIRPERIDGIGERTCLMVDDMFDTAGTLVSAAETLKNSGATHIIAAATHGLFSDPAFERLQDSCIDELIVTDTLPQERATEALGKRLHVLTVAPMLGRALLEIATNGSVSGLFNDENNQ